MKIYDQYTQNKKSPISIKISYKDELEKLQVQDIHFFEQLSFIIRSHLEDSEQVYLATRKTQKDICKEPISIKLKEILKTCTYYEYTLKKASEQEKKEILIQLKTLIK